MKTFQRIFAVVLALVMSLSVIGVAAFAAENTDDTITGTSGSITIHKYEYNGTDELKNGDGTTDSATDLPEGTTALKGAGFTIYKVEDIDYLTTYYGTGTVAQPVVSKYTENGAIKEAYAGKVVKYKETVDGVEVEKTEKVTGADGIVSFTGLELGLYVVIETTPPDSVTKPCEPFLVSVPMTTVDGSGWLYDIHVYPKNGTSYGKVELTKIGEDSAKLQGVTFVLQKKGVDAHGNETWTNITNKSGAQGDNTGDALTLTTNANGMITVEGLSNGTYRFIETSVGENVGYILNGAATYEFTVNNGEITYNNTTAAVGSINVTNEKPDLNKEVKNDEDNWGNAADYSVGDTIPYRITVDVPSNVASLRTFTVTDTPTNLVDNVNSIVIKNAEGTVIFDNTDDDDNNNIGAKEGNGFKIEFNSYNEETKTVTSALADYAGQKIVIEYNAVLQTSAEIDADGNPNTAELKYSNAIYPTGDPTNPNNGGVPKEDKITDQAIVYTFKLDVLKTNESKQALEGVVFDLYLYNGTDTVTEALLESTGTKIGSYTTDEDGKISVSGLENGNYYLVETKTNAGYNLLKSPVKVEINVAYAVETKTTTTYKENGDVIATEVSTKTFTENNGTENDGIFGTTIINKTGFTLPQTGGIGTLMFIIFGGVLIAGGICLIAVPNKKRSV